ncbi:hypothetical protein PIIN_09129 [Serendipita indica DSM 11827]|uniref:Uncharacterized protein n=1 Tax=Serendipita indica (strain DSM 11827) TaxID=1109443 RepID=G4TV02_SERID|nr:hypothetical protein PIIN_09129 [Serendipita indica DSM 11827]
MGPRPHGMSAIRSLVTFSKLLLIGDYSVAILYNSAVHFALRACIKLTEKHSADVKPIQWLFPESYENAWAPFGSGPWQCVPWKESSNCVTPGGRIRNTCLALALLSISFHCFL